MVLTIGAAITAVLSWGIVNMKLLLELLALLAMGVTAVKLILSSARS